MGTWGENRPMMDAFRRRIAAEPDKIGKIIESCHLAENDFGVFSSTWKRMEVPPGIPLGLKGWYCSKEVYVGKAHPDMTKVGTKDILGIVREDFKTLAPLYHLLRGAYEEAVNDQRM
jgi:hypothetical protein